MAARADAAAARGSAVRVRLARVSHSVDLRREIEQLPLGGAHRLIVGVLALATLFDGYDVFVPAYVIPQAMRSWRLVPSEAGLLVSSGLIGFMAGSLVNGALADRIGRKPVLVGALAVAALGNAANALWADSFGRFLAARLITGIGLGMILPLAVTLVNEISPRARTNSLVGWMMSGWSIGGVAAALAGLALAPSHGWTALFGVGALAAPVAALAAVLLPESPRFLAIRGRQRELRAVMARLCAGRAERYREAEFSSGEDAAHRGSFALLLAPAVRRGTLIVWTCSGLSLFAIFGLSSWTPQIMLERGAHIGTSFAYGALLQSAAVVGGIGCGSIADRAGRDRTLLASWLLGAASVAAIALVRLPATDVAALAVAGFFVMGAQTVLNNRTAALYDTEIRSTGVGVELGVGRLGAILGPYIGGWIEQLAPGSAALFLSIAGVLVVCAAFIGMLQRTAPELAASTAE